MTDWNQVVVQMWNSRRGKQLLLFAAGTLGLAALAIGAGAVEGPSSGDEDLWIHPRNDAYDPSRHYKDPSGELFYKEENDIAQTGPEVAQGLGAVVIQGGAEPRVTVELGADVWEFVSAHG